LSLDDEVVREAKLRAVTDNLTLSELVNLALRRLLRAERSGPGVPFRMVTYGPPDGQHHEPADFAATVGDDDLRGIRGP
jgi:hypothetical protein